MANLQVFDPFENLDETFRTFWRPVRFEVPATAPNIKIEVTDHDNAYQVKAQIPGAKKEDIKVTVEGNVVSISAETKQEKEEKRAGKVIRSEFQYGSAQRSFSLGCDIDAAKAQARYQDGVLELMLPKLPGSKQATLQVQ